MENQFIKIGDRVILATELCKLAGVEPKGGLQISVGERTPEGAFEAYVVLGDPADYPGVNVSFRSDKGDGILLSRSEQDLSEKDSDGKSPMHTFLYGRGESYVAYTTHDVRSEEELGDGRLRTLVVASGDVDNVVDLYRENQYVSYNGLMQY